MERVNNVSWCCEQIEENLKNGKLKLKSQEIQDTTKMRHLNLVEELEWKK